jgi:site-specific DNA recombinase
MTMPARAALYLRVSTGRQADSDLSIPDQRRQAKAYCTSRGWEIVADYVEPGASATDDRRPEFQRMIDAATTKPPAFDVVLVHSFSRFFRDQFQLEFYVRRLAKAGVRLVSITQELGDDPMSNMIRQIMALFDEYQSKENAKHTLRAMKENARQGFWNGALPPIGYRIVEGSEQRGHRTKKTLEIDPVQAETVRLIFRLAREGSGSSGPMGVKSIATHLNASGVRTRDGGRWGVDAVHKVLTRTTYIGRHRFNTKFWKTRERKAETEIVEMAVPAIVDKDEFEVVQMLLKSRSPAMTAPRIVSGPTLLTGICFCAACGGAMTLRTGKSGRYRYYTCCTKGRQGETGCPGRTVPMEKLDNRVAEYIEQRLLQPKRLEQIPSHVLDRRTERAERRKSHIAELRKQAAEADAKLKRLYDAIENGVADLSDPMLKDRIAELKATRDQARLDAERAEDASNGPGQLSHRRRSRRLEGQPASACGPMAAAIAAIISARSPSASKSIRKNCASWDRKARCCARSSLLQAQKRRVLACPPQIRSQMLFTTIPPKHRRKRGRSWGCVSSPISFPRDAFCCQESWSEWQDLNLRPSRPERGGESNAHCPGSPDAMRTSGKHLWLTVKQAIEIAQPLQSPRERQKFQWLSFLRTVRVPSVSRPASTDSGAKGSVTSFVVWGFYIPLHQPINPPVIDACHNGTLL